MTNDPRYGHAHQRTRAAWAPAVALGIVKCSRCGELITPGEDWHLDHHDDHIHYLGPAHARCNTAAGGRRSGEVRANRTRSTREL